MDNNSQEQLDNRDPGLPSTPSKIPFVFKRSARLGILFSQKAISFCLAYKRIKTPVILDIHTEPFSENETADSEIFLDHVIGKVHKYISSHNIQGVPINIGLMGHDIAFRRMYLPSMPASELSDAVKWEGEKLFPFPFSESTMNYSIVDTTTHGESKTLGINIVAAKSVLIEGLYSKFTSAGMKLGQVNFLPGLISEILREPSKVKTGQRQILLHLDDKGRSIAGYIHNGHLEFFQEFVTPLFYDENSDTGISNVDAIAEELQSFQDLYIAQSRISDIDSIIISGPFSGYEGLTSYFADKTGFTCTNIESVDAYRNILSNVEDENSGKYLPIIMTALANPAVSPLAPLEVCQRIESKKFITRIGAVAAIAVISVATIQMLQMHHESHLSEDLEATRIEVKTLENSPAYQGYLNLAGKLKRSQSYLKLAQSSDDSHFHTIIKALAQDVPSEVNFTDIQFKNFDEGLQLRLMGHVKVNNFSPEIILAQYVEALRKLPFLQNVTVTNHHKQKKDERFDLFFQIQMDTQV